MWLKKLAVSYPDGDSSIKSILFSEYTVLIQILCESGAICKLQMVLVTLFLYLENYEKNGISCVK